MATARHPKATFFVQRHLFSGLTTFAELESKIAALPDEQSRGAAFEVFAEAYLATQRKHDVAQIWPHGSVPLDILKNLGLTQQDQGVDGVLQTLLGQFNAYQVKFRTGRPALTWRELATFIGLADSSHIHSRVLLTNCDELPAVLNEKQGFFCIRGADLDRLEADDFRAIEAWLAAAAYIAPKKSPQPHQTEALTALLPALQTEPRVSAIMACGTGKTLVALWVAEHVAQASSPAGSGDVPPPVGEHAPGRCLNPPPGTAAPRILILLSSLALLRQTLHEWLRETHLPSLAYLCVCSDPTVKEGIDTLTTQQSDFDFQVSTDAASVRRFLDAPFAGVKMIFSTYQSASVVGAAMLPGEVFDFAVFDEAHKTAGREGRNFAFALDDKNLPIRKRLFLTATPRHYNPHDRDREGEARLLFSMDNPAVYGPQAYRLTFAEAARRGIICGYKVIISVITSEMVTNDLLSHGEVLVNGDAVRARQVANQIALRDAIEKYGVKKVFTFHRDVKSAQSFVSAGPEGVGTHLLNVGDDVRSLTSNSEIHSPKPETSQSLVTSSPTNKFQTFHVNGSMPTARRERELRDFRAAARAVVSNARCLTEGVDVPAVDMVAFLSPRRSRVDIVQATGRAMRRSPGKTTGYVLVPLYVELTASETVEAAVNRAQFDEVWDVLNSLQEQDEALAELIRHLGEQIGSGKGFDTKRFADKIDFDGHHLELEALRAAVATRSLENLCSSWDIWFGKLKAFKEQFGHCDISKARGKKHLPLAVWASSQRTQKSRGKLDDFKAHKLDSIGFIWSLRDLQWYRMLDQYRHHKQKYGDSYGMLNFKKYGSLRAWIRNQRIALSEKKLEAAKIEALVKVGFIAEGRANAWELTLQGINDYHRQHGDCFVHFGWSKGNHLMLELFDWARLHRKGQLSPRISEVLDKLGMKWEMHELKWHIYFSSLKYCRAIYGHLDVPEEWSKYRGFNFPSWFRQQRIAKRQNRLDSNKIKLLEQISFPWEAGMRTPEQIVNLKIRKQQNWDKMLAELQEHCAEAGQIYTSLASCHINLRNWLRRQIVAGQNSRLTDKQKQKLEELGVRWNAEEFDWNWEWTNAKEHFDLRGSLKKAGTRTLDWLRKQRAAMAEEALSPEQVALLGQIDPDLFAQTL